MTALAQLNRWRAVSDTKGPRAAAEARLAAQRLAARHGGP